MTRLQRLYPAIACLVPLLVYGLTMPRTITLEDAGLFQMVCHLGGIGHPPGYPLFTSLCQGFVAAMPESGVVPGNLLSALFAALACTLLYRIGGLLNLSPLASLFTALAYGLSATLWSQAIIIEVYTLAACLFLLTWLLVLRFRDTGGTGWLLGAALVTGLAVANHWPLQILAGPALVASLMGHHAARVLRQPSTWLLLAAAFALGLTPYLLLLRTEPVIAVYGEISSAQDLLRYISRAAYSDDHLGAGSLDRWQYAAWLTRDAALQLGWVCLPLVLVGAIVAWQRLDRWLASAIVLLFLSGTYLLNLLLNFRFDDLWQAVFRPYPIIAYVALSVWAGIALEALIERLPAARRQLAPALAMLMVLAIGAHNAMANNRSQTRWMEDFGRGVLALLPQDAIVYLRGDFEIGVLGYLHHVAGVRPDVELRSWENLVFANRLDSPFAPDEIVAAGRREFLANTSRPVFILAAPLSPRLHLPGFSQYVPGTPGGVARVRPLYPVARYVTDLYAGGLITDVHERHAAHLLLLQFTRYLLLLDRATGLDDDEVTWLAELQRTFPGALITLEQALVTGDAAEHLQPLLALGSRMATMDQSSGTRESQALYHEYHGRLLQLDGQHDAALAAYNESLNRWPLANNTSLCPLATLLAETGARTTLDALRARFPDTTCLTE